MPSVPARSWRPACAIAPRPSSKPWWRPACAIAPRPSSKPCAAERRGARLGHSARTARQAGRRGAHRRVPRLRGGVLHEGAVDQRHGRAVAELAGELAARDRSPPPRSRSETESGHSLSVTTCRRSATSGRFRWALPSHGRGRSSIPTAPTIQGLRNADRFLLAITFGGSKPSCVRSSRHNFQPAQQCGRPTPGPTRASRQDPLSSRRSAAH